MSIGVVLHEPEQPGNTGAIGRTCICAGATTSDATSCPRSQREMWFASEV